MYVDVTRQAQILLDSVLTGVALGIAYDVLRALRRSFGWRWLAFLLDILFWLGVILLLFRMALMGEGGEVRLYLAAAFLVGGGVYLLTLSRLVLPLLLQILELLAKFWRWITIPARKTAGAAKKVFRKQKKDFQNWWKWYRITMDYYYPEVCQKGASQIESQTRRRWNKNLDTRPDGGLRHRAAVHAHQADRCPNPEGSEAGSGSGAGGAHQRTERRHRSQRRSGIHHELRPKRRRHGGA
jgi:spore cortex biosynthesis protein YabQ